MDLPSRRYNTFDVDAIREGGSVDVDVVPESESESEERTTGGSSEEERYGGSPRFRDLEGVPESHIATMESDRLFSSQNFRAARGRRRVSDRKVTGVVFPWTATYRAWWGLTVAAAAVTVFFETFMVAFAPSTLMFPFTGQHYFTEYILTEIFLFDVLVKLRLAFYDERDVIVFDKALIARSYLASNAFKVDVAAVFPFDFAALFLLGRVGEESSLTNYLALFRLVRLLRTYRLRDLFAVLRYDTRISLFGLTILRNFAAALVWTHLGACALYFASKQSFAQGARETFLGERFEAIDELESYTITLYWSVVTFSTVGYGDFSPANCAERIVSVLYVMGSIVIQAWIIGSITLLLIKKDEKTGHYRDTLEKLDRYSEIHGFDEAFRKRLETQLQLNYHTREIADESILRFFPVSTRRRVLRKLYGPVLADTELLRGVRPQFVDAFLSASWVEIFSPGEEILRRNAISSDLYLLVGGRIRCGSGPGGGGGGDRVPPSSRDPAPRDPRRDDYDDDYDATHRTAGDFVNEIGFFTESPQLDTVTTVTVCKTLTISRSAYGLLAQDHPGCSGRILRNLLEKVQAADRALGSTTARFSDAPPPPMIGPEYLRAGSAFSPHRTDTEGWGPRCASRGGSTTMMSDEDLSSSIRSTSRRLASTSTSKETAAIEDLVRMHIEKQKDDHTTRFLFAASRGDARTVSAMCEQGGFDPNSTDYDSRSALMVASMKGNAEVAAELLRCGADPNLVDMHGSSALYEAARNGHEGTMEVLLRGGAELRMDDGLAASVLDRAVFDGNTPLLRRLLRAGIRVDACDYDQRRAVHLAAAEGNLPALELLVEFGADLTARDRWGNSAEDEAARAAESGRVLAYLRSLKNEDDDDDDDAGGGGGRDRRPAAPATAPEGC